MTAVLLNTIDHHDVTIRLGHGARFGDAVNQAIVFPTEFEDVAREYPIVFARDTDDRLQAVALLGLDADENLYLSGDRWDAHYVPAIRQHGPFSILQGQRDGADGPVIGIDLDHPRVMIGGGEDGEPVFLPHGGNAPYLEHVAGVLRRIHVGHAAMAPMFAAYEAEGLIEPVTLQVSLDETLRYDLPDFHTLGVDALEALDDAALGRLHRAGFLRTAFAAAASLGNIARLIDLKNARRRLA